ncbi:MAG: glycosyltransferase family 39 protein [Isosphaeraceae bacterium]|nr:glycosyltransferase family 39 protein [Isosphaeraceae bacterium]
MSTRRALFVLIGLTAALRLVWAGSLGLGNDEAYHYLFTIHRDWSYFDHPPMLSLAAGFGRLLGAGSSEPIFLRIGFIALFAGSTWLMARLAGRFFGERAGFWAAFALNVSAYHTAAVGAFALPDGPLLFFWLLTLDRLASAFDEPDRLARWASVGFAWGCAALSKYHAVFLPMGALVYVVLEPRARRVLAKPGPYLAGVIGSLLFAPVIYWNATHDWASFAFQGGRAVGRGGLDLGSLAGALVGQGLYLFPWVWFGLIAALIGVTRRALRGGATAGELFLASQSVTPLLLFSVVAAMRPILPHWTLVGFLSAFPLLGRICAELEARNPGRMALRARLTASAAVLAAVVFAIQHHTGFLQIGAKRSLGLIAAEVDPTAEMYGWDRIRDRLDAGGWLDRPDVFLYTGNWYTSGQLAHAVRDRSAPVLCYHAWDARSFGYWSRPEEWVGKTGVLVVVRDRDTIADAYDRYFRSIDLRDEFEVVRSGGRVRKVRIYECSDQQLAFPFGNGKRDEVIARIAAETGEVGPNDVSVDR